MKPKEQLPPTQSLKKFIMNSEKKREINTKKDIKRFYKIAVRECKITI